MTGSRFLKMLLVLCVLNGTLVSASALADLCCVADEEVVAASQPDDQAAEPGHLPHCCHATVHLTGLLSLQSLDAEPSTGDLPFAAPDDRIFFAQAPPLRPPIA